MYSSHRAVVDLDSRAAKIAADLQKALDPRYRLKRALAVPSFSRCAAVQERA